MNSITRIASYTFLTAAISLLTASPSRAENVYPEKWEGSWSVGLFLDGTDCDTDEIRFLKEEVDGLIKISKAKKTINRVRVEYVKTSGLARTWETFKRTDVTGRRFRGLHAKSSGGALIKEKLKIFNVRRNLGEVSLTGTVSYRGERCTYEYSGSISRS